MPTPKREIIKSLIEQGNATKESIMRDAEVSPSSLNTNFLYLRLMGFYPVADAETGVYRLISEVEWNEFQKEKEERAQARKARPTASLKEMFLAAVKRNRRAFKTLEFLLEKQKTDTSELTKLKVIKADAEFKISNIVYADLETRCKEAGYDPDGLIVEMDATDTPVAEDPVIEEHETTENPEDLI